MEKWPQNKSSYKLLYESSSSFKKLNTYACVKLLVNTNFLEVLGMISMHRFTGDRAPTRQRGSCMLRMLYAHLNLICMLKNIKSFDFCTCIGSVRKKPLQLITLLMMPTHTSAFIPRRFNPAFIFNSICVVWSLFLSAKGTALTVCGVCVCFQGVSGLSDQPSTGADGGVEKSRQHSG